ncbi:hypothetical protein NQ317_019251 [Molorchus minor]|uniref:thioredoxin-dependent peroxiredoxin n=1 Tax=Molorchus minor TaxID=1323400 RepID=A0ABQ9J3E5_9CUCU|nr:hypothetical protein NQ317_019251 [Molorchus minor]
MASLFTSLIRRGPQIATGFPVAPTLCGPRVQQPAPDFSGIAVINDTFQNIQLSDFKRKILGFSFLPSRFEGGLGKLRYPLLSDINKEIAKKYDVLLDKEGVALRGMFIIDPNSIALRVIEALRFVEEHGEVCPANWKKGEKTIKPDPKGSQEYFKSVSK